jgi:hypothetical protein
MFDPWTMSKRLNPDGELRHIEGITACGKRFFMGSHSVGIAPEKRIFEDGLALPVEVVYSDGVAQVAPAALSNKDRIVIDDHVHDGDGREDATVAELLANGQPSLVVDEGHCLNDGFIFFRMRPGAIAA